MLLNAQAVSNSNHAGAAGGQSPQVTFIALCKGFCIGFVGLYYVHVQGGLNATVQQAIFAAIRTATAAGAEYPGQANTFGMTLHPYMPGFVQYGGGQLLALVRAMGVESLRVQAGCTNLYNRWGCGQDPAAIPSPGLLPGIHRGQYLAHNAASLANPRCTKSATR